MAKDKKSFLIYCDIIKTIDHLTNEEKGILFQHLLEYVNDLDPVLEDRVLLSVWKPIELQLKRDLKKYEDVKEKRSEAGKAGANKRWQNIANDSKRIQSIANIAVTDNVTVTDNVILYRVSDFLNDWNKLRKEHLKKESNLNRLTFDQKKEFDEICLTYEPEQIRNAMIGLFKQKKFPNDNSVMNSSPKHFLNHFETYLQAYNDKNDSLYGKIE